MWSEAFEGSALLCRSQLCPHRANSKKFLCSPLSVLAQEEARRSACIAGLKDRDDRLPKPARYLLKRVLEPLGPYIVGTYYII